MKKKELLKLFSEILDLEKKAASRAWDKSEFKRSHECSKWRYDPSKVYATISSYEKCIEVEIPEDTSHDCPDDIYLEISMEELSMTDDEWKNHINEVNNAKQEEHDKKQSLYKKEKEAVQEERDLKEYERLLIKYNGK